MRLITGHPSIWVKDQKDLQQDYINSNRRSFIFEDRVLRLPAWDEQAIDFLRLTRHYIDNPNRKTGSKHEFFEWNPQKQAEASMREEMLVVDAMGVAFQASGEKMRKHALFLGIQFSDELGEIKSDEAIKRDYLLYAKNNAKRFMETIDSPLVEVKYLVTKAIRDSKIDIGREKNKAYFANGGGFIISIPQGSRPVDVLSEFATNGTEEGKDFLNNLRKVIN